MNTRHRSIRAAALCLALSRSRRRLSAAELTLPRDGWASWQVAAVEGAPAWCCWNNCATSRRFADGLSTRRQQRRLRQSRRRNDRPGP